jgi:CheY-like chemotaxis protein
MNATTEHTPAKILVIEDDETFGAFLLDLLQSKGYSTLLAPNGEVGLDRYLQECPDLVLTDIFMPYREGIGVITQIRTRDRTTPIIAMSGGVSTQGHSYLRAASALGANATLAKPFAVDTLLQSIQSLLGAR